MLQNPSLKVLVPVLLQLVLVQVLLEQELVPALELELAPPLPVLELVPALPVLELVPALELELVPVLELELVLALELELVPPLLELVLVPPVLVPLVLEHLSLRTDRERHCRMATKFDLRSHMVRTFYLKLLAHFLERPHTYHKSCNHLRLQAAVPRSPELELVPVFLELVLVPAFLELVLVPVFLELDHLLSHTCRGQVIWSKATKGSSLPCTSCGRSHLKLHLLWCPLSRRRCIQCTRLVGYLASSPYLSSSSSSVPGERLAAHCPSQCCSDRMLVLLFLMTLDIHQARAKMLALMHTIAKGRMQQPQESSP